MSRIIKIKYLSQACVTQKNIKRGLKEKKYRGGVSSRWKRKKYSGSSTTKSHFGPNFSSARGMLICHPANLVSEGGQLPRGRKKSSILTLSDPQQTALPPNLLEISGERAIASRHSADLYSGGAVRWGTRGLVAASWGTNGTGRRVFRSANMSHRNMI